MPEMTLPALAKAITSNISLLTTALEVENQKAPSFQPGGLDKYPEAKSVQEPRQALIELANDLYHLVLGPGEYIKQQAFLVGTIGCASDVTEADEPSLTMIGLPWRY